MMDWKSHPSFDGHEDVVFVRDEALGLAGVIGIHSTVLGPAGGGVRIWTYPRDDDALTDVLRLSRGMTYKNAMADLPLGGGKTVIYKLGADRHACFEKLGDEVEALGGRYIAAEDVGATIADMRAIAGRTSYVAGLPREAGQAGGDPSIATARGVYLSIVALLGGNVRGKRIAVQGVGSVGFRLCQHLTHDGAKLVIADVNKTNLARAEPLGAEMAPVDQIHAVAADLFSPCALGAGLNAETIPELGASLVCGAANNQLAVEEDGARLQTRGITYAPDYVVNAGGIISVSAEYLGEPESAVDARVAAIAPRLLRVLETAKSEGVTPHQAADRIVRARLASAQKERA